MTQHLDPCPMCGREVPYTTALDDGEDVRWAEWSCPCGLYYHAESRIVNERGVHDEEAELAELFGAWNERAVRKDQGGGCASNELEPCPFCWGNALITEGLGEYWASCSVCNASTEMCVSEELAAAAWNTRAVRTCRIVEDEDDRPSCSLCGANYLCMLDATYCPDCGAKVEGVGA